MHHQSHNGKSWQQGEKVAKYNFPENVTYTIVTYKKLITVLTASNVTPPPPNQFLNCYHLTLKFCHRIVSKCCGCRALFLTDGYPKESYHFTIVLKTQRSYIKPKTRQKIISSDFTNVFSFTSTGALY